MFQPILQETEVTYRQQYLRAEFIRAQRQISIAGLRQIVGNTVIEMGSRIHGVAQDSCAEAAEFRGLIRSTMRSAVSVKSGS